MQNKTDTTKKASAPETRVADLKGHINYDEKAGCWMIGDTPIDSTERTLPAESGGSRTTKPSHVDNIMSLIAEYDELHRHAEALAEALRHLEAELHLAFDDVPAGIDAWMATARQALAAWGGVK